MPADFAVSAENLRTVLRELSRVDPNLRKELRTEMKSAVNPLAQSLANDVPKTAPLSGFSKTNASATLRSGKPNFYRWASPKATVLTPLAKRTKKAGFYPVVSIRMRSRKGFAGFEIMELAGSRSSGLTSQGRAMIRGLNSRYPIRGGLGRFVIPQFKDSGREVQAEAKKILVGFAEKVNRRLK